MNVAFFSCKPYDRKFFEQSKVSFSVTLNYLESRLCTETAMLAQGCEVVCAFVNDSIDSETLETLSSLGVRHIALRCAGYNNVDIKFADSLGIMVSRVPAYSPHAVAEHTVALLLGLNRKVHRAHNRVREGNFALEGLLGFDLYGLTVGVVGTGNIGENVARIMLGFGCKVLAYDPIKNSYLENLGATYVDMDSLLRESDIVTLHSPLSEETYHCIDEKALSKMKDGVVILNTSRGGLIDTKAMIQGLKSKKIGSLGLDVYEEESNLFFEDLSSEVIQDDVFARLTTFPNVIITGHQGFFTRDALSNIAETTLQNIREFSQSGLCANSIKG